MAVLVLGQVLDEGGPPLDHRLWAHVDVDDADVAVIILEEKSNILVQGFELLTLN